MKGILFLLVVTIVSSGCSNDVCESKKPGSFGSFLDDDWRTYCNEYESHVTEPLEYNLIDLAEFFGNHPGKVEELNQSLIRFKDVKTCFDTNSKFLEYRELQGCITEGDVQDIRMMNSFSTAIDPWMQNLSYTVGDINPKLNRSERLNTRLLTKASEALDYHRIMGERERIADHFEDIKLLKKSIIKARSKSSSFEQFRQGISPNAALNEKLDDGLLEEYQANKETLRLQKERISKIETDSEFIKIVQNSAGKACPNVGRKRPKETSIAIKAMRSYFRKVESGRIRIDGPIKSQTKDGEKSQTFSGLVCGRRTKKMLEREITLCAVHRFEVSRTKEKKGRWTKWKGEATEGDLKDGVDCASVD